MPTLEATRPPELIPEADFGLSSNFVLSSLPQHEYLPLRARLKQVDLTQGEIIQEAQSRIRHAYFVEAGVVSMQVVMTEGREIEVALVGSEGMVGLALLGGGTTAYCRGMVEVPGRALRIEADALQAAVAHSKALEQACVKYARLEAAHTAQLAACNALHQVEQRLARWILMAQDRLGGEQVLPLTHEFLAHMLGTNRATVSLAAEALKAAGLIGYTRRKIQVTNRKTLETIACECYAVLRRHLEDYRRGETDSRLAA